MTGHARAKVVVRNGWVTWSCPLCEHPPGAVPHPAARHAWVMSRAAYHMQWSHRSDIPAQRRSPARLVPITI